MKSLLVIAATASVIAAVLPAQTPQATRKFPLAESLVRSHDAVQRNLSEAAEKMPEEHYGFKPTPEMRPFGQVVAHIALSSFRTCSTLKGEDNPRASEKEDQVRTKAQAVALLNEAGTYCRTVFSGMTDESLVQFLKLPGANATTAEVAKGVFVAGETGHGNEVYGTMAVYLRLKGIVPPTTARQKPKTEGTK